MMSEKYQFFDGRKFTRDETTGYYLCSSRSANGVRKRMHVYVWEYYNGLVPKGFQVHHIDENKSNNDISNLELLSITEHLSFHGKERYEKNSEMMLNNLRQNAIPKASEWHKSKDGHEWHKEHYEEFKHLLHVEREFKCQFCGKDFKSTQSQSKFCSNKCKSAARRASGIDNISKICADCGGEYISNKYSKTKFCPLCKSKKHKRNRK